MVLYLLYKYLDVVCLLYTPQFALSDPTLSLKIWSNKYLHLLDEETEDPRFVRVSLQENDGSRFKFKSIRIQRPSISKDIFLVSTYL